MMRKRILVLLIFLFSVSQSFAANVAIIVSNDISSYNQAKDNFKKYLSEKNPGISYQEYGTKEKQIEEIVSQVATQKPSLIFVLGVAGLKALKDKISDIPIVFCMVYEQEMTIASNITGVSLDIPAQHKLNVLKQVIPGAKKLGVLSSDSVSGALSEYNSAASKAGYIITRIKANNEQELIEGFKGLIGQMDCYMMIPDKIYTLQSIKYILLESLKNKIPVVGLSVMFTKAGAVVSFDCNYDDLGRQAGEVASRVIGGESPSSIKVEKPRKMTFSLNTVAAQKLGIKIDQNVIKEASEVFNQ